MPYDIRKFPEGYKVCKKGTKKCYSNDPIPLENAIAQRKAIAISEHKSGGANVDSEYVVAIPSYDRVEKIQKKTLKSLHDYKIKQKIYIFVNDKTQYDLYKTGLDADTYTDIIISNTKGITDARNYIATYFPDGTKVVCLDDDLGTFVKKTGDNKVVKLKDLNAVFTEGFKKCKEEDTKLWGIYPVPNALFMKDTITTTLKFIIGLCYGFISTPKDKSLLTNIVKQKEDYERSIKYYIKYGKVIRLNYISVRTTYYSKGGISSWMGNRKKDMEVSAKALLKKYPEYVGSIFYRKDGTAEIKLKKMNEENIEGAGKKLDIDFSDNQGEGVYYSKIEDSEKYENIKKRLFDKLEETKIPKIEGRRKDDKRTRGDLLGYNAFTMTFGCGGRRNLGIGEFSTNAKNPELFDLIIEYANLICPKGFEYQAITVNKNMKAKKHKDGSNNGMSVINGLGDFTGGGLFVYKGKTAELYDLKNHILVFNGAKLAHRTDTYKGTRYTLIFYSQKSKCENKGKVMVGGDFFDDEDWEGVMTGGGMSGGDFFDDEDWEGVMTGGANILKGGICPKTGNTPCECVGGGDIDWSALGNIAYDIVKTQQKDQGYKPNKRKEGDDERNWGYDEEEEVEPPPPPQPLFGDPTQLKPQAYDPNNPLMYMGGSIPINKKLYEKAKEIVYPKYKKPSAYRSGAVVKLYKQLGGKFKEKGERKLKRWFAEDWKDVGNKNYPVYRPSRRITKDTPLTADEIDPKNLKQQIALKQKIKGSENLPKFEGGGKLYAKDKYATGEKQLTPTEKSLVKKEMGEANPEIAEIEADPMGDDDIKKYFPNAKIVKYSDLKNYTDITQLLPRPKTFFYLLYERSPNVGHWTLVSRYKDNGVDTIEFFCSYGSKIDEPLTWTPIGMRVQLGEDKPYLSMLLDKSKFRTIYNPVQYQSKKSNIATCGAYATLRAGELVRHNTTLDEFNDMISEVKKATGLNYDEIVSNLVDLR